MKLYHFTPEDGCYGMQYSLAAQDIVIAHQNLLEYLKNGETQHDYNEWKNVYPLKTETFPRNYEIIEYDITDVIVAEKC